MVKKLIDIHYFMLNYVLYMIVFFLILLALAVSTSLMSHSSNSSSDSPSLLRKIKSDKAIDPPKDQVNRRSIKSIKYIIYILVIHSH